MNNGLPERLLQRRENPRRTSFLELFFDLAFIFALPRLSQALLADHTLNGGDRADGHPQRPRDGRGGCRPECGDACRHRP
ncbi:hypothetical protein FHG89_09020 [Micromonospora orduensis]|uniref:Low temperature requirement protein A n=1 Tax=Micromonospora orduensis TaxID=1420891 RepID=A0A5C4QVU1_9ACTN|nr:hypothetical protein [Micromonospora orduensis]TNH30176.1 hypothetical protein FHG89_09020 [Micromonospora orduensis]